MPIASGSPLIPLLVLQHFGALSPIKCQSNWQIFDLNRKDTHDMTLFRWLWSHYLKRHLGWLLLALFFMALEGSMLGLISWVMKPMFDNVFVGGNHGALWWVGGVILVIFTGRAVATVGQAISLTNARSRTNADMRNDLLRHLMTLSGSFHQSHPPGLLIERVQGDIGVIGDSWANLSQGLGRDLIAIIWLFGVALWVDWVWTVIALVGIPLLIAPSLFTQRYVRSQARRLRDVVAKLSTRLDEVFHGMDAIKLNRLEAHQSDRFEQLTRAQVRAEVRTAAGGAAFPGFVDLMTGIGFLGVLYYGGMQIMNGDKTVGEFMAFFTAMALAFEPLRRLGALSGQWQAAAASIERVQALFHEQPELTRPAQPRSAPQTAPEIQFDNVHLSYGDQPILRGVSFTAKAGETTALVGASGAGKSTLFRLLTRLVDPQSGVILLNGTPIDQIDPENLRDVISTVAQDAALFDETLQDNIVLGREVPAQKLQSALDAAHVADFLPRLPDGLNSPAGPRGSALSGGQRQRVAIARAVLRDTPVLLLDEATSALDTKSEALVQNALDDLAEGRTTLVIAHRLSTVQHADQIIVMDQGAIVDQGSHTQLIKRPGPYADLHAMQFRKES